MTGPQQAEQALLEVPLAAWPAEDRLAWERVQARTNSPFRKDNGGRTRSPYTYRVWQKCYGRWLGFLRDHGALDDAAAPASRVTPERLDDYIAAMKVQGNRPITIVGRIRGLKGALELLAPGQNHKWITRPRNIPITRHFEIVPRDRVVHHSTTLLSWAEQLFADGLEHSQPRCRRALVRDAALIGMLVMPAPRLGALAQLQLGRNLQRHETGWCLNQDAGITKMSKNEWAPLHAAITPILERYLAVERNELLDGRQTSQLWIALGGGDLTAAGITTRLRKLSGKSFDKVFRAHSFRHCLATTNAIDGYASPLDASVLLGHASPTTTSRFYNMAKAAAAAARHEERMQRMTQEAERASRSGG